MCTPSIQAAETYIVLRRTSFMRGISIGRYAEHCVFKRQGRGPWTVLIALGQATKIARKVVDSN